MKTEVKDQTTDQAIVIPSEDLGYFRLYFAIFGIELSEVLDIPGMTVAAD